MAFSGFPVASAVDGFGHVANRLQEDAVLILLDFGSALFQSTAVGGTGPVLVVCLTLVSTAHLPNLYHRF